MFSSIVGHYLYRFVSISPILIRVVIYLDSYDSSSRGWGSRVPFFMALDWSFGLDFIFLDSVFVEISFDLLGFSSYWLSIMWVRREIGCFLEGIA